jgi:hypothetical protein
MQQTYAVANSSLYIEGLSADTFNADQVTSTADAGGEGSTIYDSAMAFWQGFYPPVTSDGCVPLFLTFLCWENELTPLSSRISTITLANGTNVTSPLNGYQYVQINTVLPTDDVDFEGWTSCTAFTAHTNAFYASADFLAKNNLVGDRNIR